MNKVQQFEQLDLSTLESIHLQAREVRAACRRANVVHVRAHSDRGDAHEFWNELLGAAALERLSVDEHSESGEALDNLWSKVEFDPCRQDRFRHSRSAQPLHTDGSYVPDSPSLIVMFCEHPAREGGATTFLDGAELIKRLAAEHAPLLTDLCRRPMVFCKGGRAVTSPAILQNADGPLLRWNYYALSTDLDADTRMLADEFQSLLFRISTESIPRAVRLERGEAVIFHDDRLLHGRESFVAEVTGDRCLWKCGLRL